LVYIWKKLIAYTLVKFTENKCGKQLSKSYVICASDKNMFL